MKCVDVKTVVDINKLRLSGCGGYEINGSVDTKKLLAASIPKLVIIVGIDAAKNN